MHKGFLRSLVLVMGLFLLLGFSPCFAEESFTITTYYLSPYGSYNELEVYRSVTYKPVDKDMLSSPKEGELVYNASDDKFYYYNGSSSWVPQGSAPGESVMYLRKRADVPAGPAGCPSGWSEADYREELVPRQINF